MSVTCLPVWSIEAERTADRGFAADLRLARTQSAGRTERQRSQDGASNEPRQRECYRRTVHELEVSIGL